MGKPAVQVGSASRQPGRLEWRTLLQWLLVDGLINEDQLKRTEARLCAVDSSLRPLVRLGKLGLTRQDKGKPLDVDALTDWLARHVDLPFVRIDPSMVSEASNSCFHPVAELQALPGKAVAGRHARLAGAMKVAEGQTTIEEILRSTPAWT